MSLLAMPKSELALQDHALEQMATHGYLVCQQWLGSRSFVNAEVAIEQLLQQHYDTQCSPLRHWWLDQHDHFKKIDQAHYGSQWLRAFIQQANFSAVLQPLLPTRTTIQIWATSLLVCPKNVGVTSAVGLHTDRQYTPFIAGDYLTALIPLTEIGAPNLVLFPNSHKIAIHSHFLNPLNHNVADQVDQLEAQYPVNSATLLLNQGDILFTHANSVRGLVANSTDRSHAYLAVFFRSEANPRCQKIKHFGMCDHLDDLTLSPIIAYRQL